MSGFGHGSVGTREQAFTTLLDLRKEGYPPHKLVKLAENIKGAVDTVKDGPDPEENLWVPAGYTYFGQFIDHDLTFDNTSSLNPADTGEEDRLPTNLRTPRFDLDSLYGDGPDAQPFLYASDGASLLFKDSNQSQSQTSYEQAIQDLLRSPNGRAIIGDKRNDENSIISQIQLAFVQYHNAVVKKVSEKDKELTGTALFNQARNEVRWTYQKLVIEDFLPRIVKAEVLADLQEATTPEERENLYALYTHHKRKNLPREFVVAAYRFGHSGVRTGYRLNKETSLTIFPSSNTNPKDSKPDDDSLLGFDPLPKAHVIDDWGRFFPNTQPGVFPSENRDKAADKTVKTEVRLQFAYKIDTTLVDPLGVLPPNVLPTSATVGGLVKEVEDTISPCKLPDKVAHPPRPSLALLNLLRGNTYKVQGGQAIAHALQRNDLPVEILEQKYLCTRNQVKDGVFKFNPIDSSLQRDTPLWFYILAEAQASVVDAIKLDPDGTFSDEQLLKEDGAKTQLGWVGGRIVAEVFYGLLDSDRESYFNAAPEYWEPILGGNGEVIFANLLKFAGLTVGK
ncbi:MAG: peroxidase family protein [Nostoc sp.]|uniref:peroxidase family protein n=1 Tax=Nostoc sp. TaxID=1180 RepID=UPI002FF76E9B